MTDVTTMANIERRSSYDMRDPFNGDDSRQIVKFLIREVIDEVASKEADRLVYVGCDYISIRHPGERDEILRPVRDSDKKRWSKQWQAFEAGATQAPSGTPLSVLFPRNPEVCKNLEHDGIATIEILSGLTDTQIGNIGLGGRQFVDKAKAFLAGSNDTRVKAQEERIAALEALLAEVKKEKR